MQFGEQGRVDPDHGNRRAAMLAAASLEVLRPGDRVGLELYRHSGSAQADGDRLGTPGAIG